MGLQNDLSGLDILRTKWKFENRLNDVDCNIQTVSPDDAENQAVWAARGGAQILMPPSPFCHFCIRCRVGRLDGLFVPDGFVLDTIGLSRNS